MEALKVAVIDDQELIRKSIAQLLRQEGLNVLFDAGNGRELQEQMKQCSEFPEVILMDISMPEMDGIASTAWLSASYPDSRVIALSVMDDEFHVIRMLKAGARAYLLKNSRPAELLRAITEVREKGYHFSDLVSGTLISRIHGESGIGGQSLSDRELEFLQYCCSELTYKEIGEVMHVSPRTAEGYAKQLCEKLNIKSRVGLVLYAIKHRLTSM